MSEPNTDNGILGTQGQPVTDSDEAVDHFKEGPWTCDQKGDPKSPEEYIGY